MLGCQVSLYVAPHLLTAHIRDGCNDPTGMNIPQRTPFSSFPTSKYH